MTDTHRSALLVTILVAMVCALCGLLPARANALQTKVFTPGNFTQSGLVTVTPATAEMDVTPGKTTQATLSVLNASGTTLKLTLDSVNLAASADPDSFVQEVASAAYGAGSWITPERTSLVLVNGQQDKIDLSITPPKNAPVGSNYGGVEVDSSVLSLGAKDTTKVAYHTAALAQFYLNIPGAIRREGRIQSVSSDHDFLFHGLSFVDLSAIYQNQGNITDHVSATISITSMFGNQVASFPLTKRDVLRGSSREFEKLWTSVPWFGYFHPKVTFRTGEGVKTESYPAILILPPWWLIAAVIAAIVLPLTIRRWRRGQEWKRYMDEDFGDEDDVGLFG